MLYVKKLEENWQGNQQLDLQLNNPDQAVNQAWIATSNRFKGNKMTDAYTVNLDKSIAVQGRARGEIFRTELSYVDAIQWVSLKFIPGNNVFPTRTQSNSGNIPWNGYIVIIPPEGFQVITFCVRRLPGGPEGSGYVVKPGCVVSNARNACNGMVCMMAVKIIISILCAPNAVRRRRRRQLRALSRARWSKIGGDQVLGHLRALSRQYFSFSKFDQLF